MVVAVRAALDDAGFQPKFRRTHVPDVGRGRREAIEPRRRRLIHAGFPAGLNDAFTRSGLRRAPLEEASILVAAHRRFAATCAAPPAREEIPGDEERGVEERPAAGVAANAGRVPSRACRDWYRQPFPESSHRAIPDNPVYNWKRSAIFDSGSPP